MQSVCIILVPRNSYASAVVDQFFPNFPSTFKKIQTVRLRNKIARISNGDGFWPTPKPGFPLIYAHLYTFCSAAKPNIAWFYRERCQNVRKGKNCNTYYLYLYHDWFFGIPGNMTYIPGHNCGPFSPPCYMNSFTTYRPPDWHFHYTTVHRTIPSVPQCSHGKLTFSGYAIAPT